jgi:exodeoxyribonuclease VII large subunit
LIVPDITDLQRQVDGCTRALARQLLNRVREAQQRLDHARETLQRCLAHRIDGYRRSLLHITRALQPRKLSGELVMRRNRFADLHRRLIACPGHMLENARHRFQRIEGILRVLGPDATLRRGYSITTNERGKIIRTIAAVRPKMKIRTRVRGGEFSSEVL